MMKVAIFGLGFVGKELSKKLANSFEVCSYSKNTRIEKSIIFDATVDSDVAKLQNKAYDASIVTFPTANVSPDFFSMLFQISRQNFLLGSTGIYQRNYPGEIITEKSSLDTENKRYITEMEFLGRGGVLLRLAGIYGKRRNPLQWLNSPKIGYSNKQLNLIHVDDIVQSIRYMLQKFPVDNLYNISDGYHHTWKEIIDCAYNHRYITEKPAITTLTENSFVSNAKFLTEYPQISFTNLFTFLHTKDL